MCYKQACIDNTIRHCSLLAIADFSCAYIVDPFVKQSSYFEKIFQLFFNLFLSSYQKGTAACISTTEKVGPLPLRFYMRSPAVGLYS